MLRRCRHQGQPAHLPQGKRTHGKWGRSVQQGWKREEVHDVRRQEEKFGTKPCRSVQVRVEFGLYPEKNERL